MSAAILAAIVCLAIFAARPLARAIEAAIEAIARPAGPRIRMRAIPAPHRAAIRAARRGAR